MSATCPTPPPGDLAHHHARLVEELELHARILAQVDVAVVTVDVDRRITAWNTAAERLFGWLAEEVLGKVSADLISAEDDNRLAHTRVTLHEDGRFSGPWRLRRSDGAEFPGHVVSVPIVVDGERAGYVGTFEDTTERNRLISQLERRIAQQACVAALGERALGSGKPGPLLDDAVKMVRDTLGVELAEVLELAPGERSFTLTAGCGFASGVAGHATLPAGWVDSQEGFTLTSREPVIVADAATDERFSQSELMRRHGARSAITVLIGGRESSHGVLGAQSIRPNAFDHDDVAFLQATANVLGAALDRWQDEQEIRRRGLHDPLTGLPNRELVLDRLSAALKSADRAGHRVAVLFLDVDNFKDVNDGLGHRAGDDLLCQIATRLGGELRQQDAIGRFGGDEFVVVSEVAGELDALRLAERLSSRLGEPFELGHDERHHVGVSIGIVVQDGAIEPGELLRDADAAMYRAKARGRARIELFDTGMRSHAADRLRTAAALRRALAGDEIEVHFQPIVELEDHRIVALEALARWRDPERGLVSPAEFIPIAEESGLIVALGRRVLERSCEAAADWHAARPGRPPLPIHVNVSPRQLSDPAFAGIVEDGLRTTGAPASTIVLEITEGMLVDASPGKISLLARLRQLGVAVVLDDFGTGYSSLSYLARLDITGLKVDRSFVAGLSEGQEPIVDAVVRLAEALSLTVVAEGVETEEQLQALRALGCRHAQGFLFSRPLRREDVEPLLELGAPAPAARAA